MYSFSRSSRLVTPEEYKSVFKSKVKKIYDGFGIFVLKNSLGRGRLGLAIGKKYIPKATQRNRIKRIIRESFRLAKIGSLDVVIVAKDKLNSKNNAEIRKSLAEIWKQLEIYCQKV